MKSTLTSIVADRPREVGEEDQRALQHADEHDAVGMVGRDLGAEPRRRCAASAACVEQDRAAAVGAARHSASELAHGVGAGARCAAGARAPASSTELVLEPRLRLGVALAQVRQQHLAEQHRFALGERAVHAQVAGLDAAGEEPGRDARRSRARRRRSARSPPISRAGLSSP